MTGYCGDCGNTLCNCDLTARMDDERQEVRAERRLHLLHNVIVGWSMGTFLMGFVFAMVGLFTDGNAALILLGIAAMTVGGWISRIEVR